MKKSILSSVCLFLLVLTGKAQHMDLSGWNPSRSHIISIDSTWEFYWNRLLTPAQLDDSSAHPTALVPSLSWSDLHLPGVGNAGCATYRIRLQHVPKGEFQLAVYSLQTSSRIFINGQLLAEVGQPGTEKSTTIPCNRDVQVPVHGGQDVEIVLQVANFHHRKGGFVHVLELGLAPAIERQQMQYYGLDLVESASLAILGLFLFTLFIFRRKDLSVLYFSLFCLSLSLRPVISVNYFMAYVFPGISWPLMLRIEYLSVLFPCLFMLHFIYKLFSSQLAPWIVKVISFILIIKIVVVLVFPPIIFSWVVVPLLFVIPAGVLIFAVTIVRAVLARVEGAGFAGIGLAFLLVSLLLKVLVYAGILPPLHVLITLLDIAFIFTMSLVLGSRFSIQFVKVETLQLQTEIQHKEIIHQKELVEEKNREITDSILYAERIQQAIFPSENTVKKLLPDSFVLYKPKDIVAGDFYFLEQVNGKVIFAVGDCTGHGVPGAMVSVVCSNALNKAVKEFGLTEPGRILDKVREIVVETFNKNQEDVKDGMDISLITFSSQTLELEWAGANNPLWYFRAGSRYEIKADKQPVGRTDQPRPFTTHRLQLEKGDCVYLFTDGFADQFGGPKGKKFRYKQFQELLTVVQGKDMREQKQELEIAFEQWKGGLIQVDDVCVAGIRI